MHNKNFRKLIAAVMSAGLLMSAGIVANAAGSEHGKKVSLAIAGTEETTETDVAEEAVTEASAVEEEVTESAGDEEIGEVQLATSEPRDVETEAETQTEKNEYQQLETTATDGVAITAVDVSGIVENTMPSVVSITMKSVQEVSDYFYGGTQQYEQEGAGSGVIIAQNDDELLIATNNHIVKDTTELTVCFTVDADDEEDLLAKGVVKGTSPSNDLAVVAVKLSDINPEVFSKLKVATLGSSDKVKVGESAIVIGNALGIGQTVTTGIVSALNREVTTEDGTFTEMQVDAAVNLGCSGGAILNSKGQVIAITDAKATGDYAESMGYGIPIDTAIPILQNLINRQTRETVDQHGFLGITVVPVSDEAKEMYNMPAGAYVYEVSSGSAADKAGIEQGDIITKFDGIEIDSSTTLVDTLAYYAVGETVTVELQVRSGRGYETEEVEVTLQEGAPSTDSNTADNKDQAAPGADDDQEQEDNSGDGSQGNAVNPFEEFGQWAPFFFGNGNSGNGSY